jgi:predicted negative regulator of RcsB-dependent stress response
MKSGSSSSCVGTLFLLVVTLALIRFALPAVWEILGALFVGGIYLSLFAVLVVIGVIGFFTYRNFSKNQKREEMKKYERIMIVEELYRAIIDRLNQNMILNQVSAEELLQSEVLIHENLSNLRSEIADLKEFASRENQKGLSSQLREYQQQLRETRDPAAKEVVQQNIKMLEEKRARIQSALDEVRQKEGMVDLVFNSLKNVEEDLKFGRSVQHLFPSEIYRRFGLSPPADQTSLPPLTERSNE